MNSVDSHSCQYNDANDNASAGKQKTKQSLLKKESIMINTKHEKHLLYSKSLRFPLNFKQNNSLKYNNGLLTLVGDSNMKATIQTQLKVFDLKELNEGKSGLAFELNTGQVWQSFVKSESEVGFIESLLDSYVVRSILDQTICWRVILLFTDGNMVIQDYKEISCQREDRKVELTGQWHINSMLHNSLSIIETFKTFIIDNKTKIKTKEHESLKEYFDGKDDKHALPSAISSFSIISHNQTNEELELEFCIVVDNLIILCHCGDEFCISPRILKVESNEILKVACTKYCYDLTVAVVCSNENCIYLFKISTINCFENPVSKIRLDCIDKIKWEINCSDFSRDNIGINLIQFKNCTKYLLCYSENILQAFQLKLHNKECALRHHVEVCNCTETDYQK